MKKIQFKCTLIEDVILTLQPPQDGFFQSLNFIPGRCFRSIVANSSDEGLRISRNPKICFGDAHIAHIQTINDEKYYWRTMHIPASMMYPKHWSVGHACYLYHYYDRQKDKSIGGQIHQQMKQCRHGYYAFYDRTAHPVIIPHDSSNKYGYAPDEKGVRRGGVYVFDSIRRGSQFLFEVETQCEEEASIISSILTNGYHQIGRSKAAQYGTILIEEQSFKQIYSHQRNVFLNNKENYTLVYADSRLVFLNEDGQCTYRPTADQFGIRGGQIDWGLTQVRTFCYMPWNSKRLAQEADISGFEKGSTFVIKTPNNESSQAPDAYVGSYNQDGFGHVIYNPDFLLSQEGTNGIAYYQINETPPLKRKPIKGNYKNGIVKYLKVAQKIDTDNNYIYRKVNEFIKNYISEFRPSHDSEFITTQHWLSIRSTIMGIYNLADLEKKLFGSKNINGKYENGFLTQQSMKNKWNEKRIKRLLYFYNDFVFSGKSPLIIKAFYILISELYTQTIINSSKK